MSGIPRSGKDMPDVPDVDFIGALCEIWSGINYAGYHLAYVRVYLQTAALQVDADILRKQEQALRDMTQVDVVICRLIWRHSFGNLTTFLRPCRLQSGVVKRSILSRNTFGATRAAGRK